jgi:hypothetical protein
MDPESPLRRMFDDVTNAELDWADMGEIHDQGPAFPVGGASRIAATIVPVIEDTGGRVFTSAEVREILVEGDRAAGVRLADGKELKAPVVMSDAGIANTYRRLLRDDTRSRFGLDRVLDGHEASIAPLPPSRYARDSSGARPQQDEPVDLPGPRSRSEH